jgi:hypothetical protein
MITVRKTSLFGKKAKKVDPIVKKAKSLGIKLSTKRNGKRVKKTKALLEKQIKSAMRAKVIGKKRKSLPFLSQLKLKPTLKRAVTKKEVESELNKLLESSSFGKKVIKLSKIMNRIR